MTPEHTTSAESVPVTLARLEGKLDTALAIQAARVDEHARRLDVVDTRLNAHSADLASLSTAVAAIPPPPPPPPRTAGWTVASVIIGAVVGLGSLLTVMVMLMQIVPDAS